MRKMIVSTLLRMAEVMFKGVVVGGLGFLVLSGDVIAAVIAVAIGIVVVVLLVMVAVLLARKRS